MWRKLLRSAVTVAAMALAALFFTGCGSDNIVGFDEPADQGSAPEVKGTAHLENMENHSGISVEMADLKVNLVTDESGKFSLMAEIADGTWTLRAVYPYFYAVEQEFTIVNGLLDSALEAMTLRQKIVFNVYVDKLTYTYGETVFITLEALNVTNDAVTLSSLSSPMDAYAVRFEDQTVVGGLFPGQGSAPQETTLAPGEVRTFEQTWTIDNYDLPPGEYQVYAALTNSAQYPNYFSAESELAAQFNESLYSKLTPATITLTAP
jgi:hypothetical protein